MSNTDNLPPITLHVPAGELDPERDQLLARGYLLGAFAAFEAIGDAVTPAQREQALQLLAHVARGERTFADAPDDQPDPARWPSAMRFLAAQRDDAGRILRFMQWARRGFT